MFDSSALRVFLSHEAFELANGTKVRKPHEGPKAVYVSAHDDLAEIARETPFVSVVVNVEQIDDKLAWHLSELADRFGTGIGIVPFSSRYVRHVIDNPRDSAEAAPPSRCGVYSCESLRHEDLGARDDLQLLTSEKAFNAISLGRWAALAITTAGRQTFCSIGRGALHSGIGLQFDDVAARRYLTPSTVDCEHWFVQSCHSPFVWRDFGDYLSVPLAFVLLGNARTFICSTRLQTYTPGILGLYIRNARAGTPFGLAVLEMNRYCARSGIDRNPFILFGDPSASLRVSATNSEPRSETRDRRDEPRAELRETICNYANILANLTFIANETHFAMSRGAGRNVTSKACVARLRRSAEALKVVHQEALHELRVPEGRFADERAWQRNYLYNRKYGLDSISHWLRTAWETSPGYYYLHGEQLEKSFLPLEAHLTGRQCPSCGSALVSRRWRYAAASGVRDYEFRTRLICPRCLTVRDASDVVDQALSVSFDRSSDGGRIAIRYQNQLRDPTWVFAFVSLSDPQNISARTAKGQYYRLLANVRVEPVRFFTGETIAPDRERVFEFRVSGIPEDWFYLLVEFNLFVDFGWNWLSFTHRAPKLASWLRSPEYRSTLPVQHNV